MADISTLLRLVSGINRTVDMATNSLVTQSLKLTDDGGSTSSELTKTILDNLITLQDGSDISAALHHHDGRYYTETEIGSTSNGEGASLVGIEDAGALYTGTDAEAALQEVGQDAADLRTLSGTSDGDTDLGTFTGTTISDNTDIKSALQELETEVELKADDADVIKKDGSVDFTGDQSMGNNKLTNLATPTADADAATKAYVDAAAAGIDWKESVRAATTAAGTLASDFEDGDSIDGVTLATGDRILIKDQASGDENGIYTVNASGAPTRATDADTDAEVTSGMAVFVEEGTANADSGWVLTTDNPITVDTTALTFVQFTGLGQITAGDGLSKTGSTIDVNVDDSTIEINADTLRVKAAGIDSNELAADSVTAAKLNSDTAGDGLVQAAGGELDVNVDDSTIEINADTVRVKASGIDTNELADDSVTADKLNSDTAGVGITQAAGGELDLDVDSLTAETTADDADTIAIYDDSASAMRKMTRANFLTGVTASEAASVRISLTNNTGSQIDAGDVVALSKSTAGEIIVADASAIATAEGVVGVAAANISNGASGDVIIQGIATVNQTSAFTLGARVYLSEVAGEGTSTAPSTTSSVVYNLGPATSTTQVLLQPQLVAINEA